MISSTSQGIMHTFPVLSACHFSLSVWMNRPFSLHFSSFVEWKWEQPNNKLTSKICVNIPKWCITHTTIIIKQGKSIPWSRHQIVELLQDSRNSSALAILDLCEETTSHRWIPLTKVSDAELWCFPWSAPDQTVERTNETPLISDATALVIGVTVMTMCQFYYPDSKVHGANMGPTWALSAPVGPNVGPMNLAIRVMMPRGTDPYNNKSLVHPSQMPTQVSSRAIRADWWALRESDSVFMTYRFIQQ